MSPSRAPEQKKLPRGWLWVKGPGSPTHQPRISARRFWAIIQLTDNPNYDGFLFWRPTPNDGFRHLRTAEDYARLNASVDFYSS